MAGSPVYITANSGSPVYITGVAQGDTVNAVAFGADPTGQTDSSAAINTAASLIFNGVSPNVSLPAGNYYLTNSINLTNGQTLIGEGRGTTTLLIDQGFSSKAIGVIVLSSNQDPGPEVRELGIRFSQPSDQALRSNFLTLAQGGTSGLGGTGVKYPPAIIATSASARYKVQNVRISRAWDGIYSSGVNAVWWIDDVEVCALNTGLNWGGSKDFCHIKGYHFWDFDIPSTSALYTGVYKDGNTFAALFGEIDGLNASDFTSFSGRVQINSPLFFGHFSNLMMDNDNATLEILKCVFCQVSNLYATGTASGANTNSQLTIGGGNVFVNNVYLNSVNVTGGVASISVGRIASPAVNLPLVTQSGGTLALRNMLLKPAAGVWQVAPVQSSGILAFQANLFTQGGTTVGLALSVDSIENTVSGNNLNGWTFTPPGQQGTYE